MNPVSGGGVKALPPVIFLSRTPVPLPESGTIISDKNEMENG